MCGFAGVLRWSGLNSIDAEQVRGAAAVLAHRGPDGAGLWHDGHIALGFRRLKIIDLTSAGDQPMANETGALQVVFNGEIYNYRELREELRALGHNFKSNSDTEVLLHGYEQHGEALFSRLRGMFAFALWDARERRLLLVRDPVGVKPLYFSELHDGVAFASEAKALFALGVKPEIDPIAIDEALTYRYVPAPRTGFKDVEKLPPGHLAVAENGALSYRRWWTTGRSASKSQRFLHGVDQPAGAQAEAMLKQSVERRLVSDVPLGVWLSGGIDSGLIAGAMGGARQSFTAGFTQPEYDERELARETAGALGFKHTEFEVPAHLFNVLPQIVWHADEPFFDSSCLPAFVLSERTKAHATVVLSGDGGDESFAGYDRYLGLQLLERYKKVPGILRATAIKFAEWRHPIPSRQGWDRMLRWLEKCRRMEQAGHHPYIAAMELFDPVLRNSLYSDDLRDALDGCDSREHLDNAILRARQAIEDPVSPLDKYTPLPGILQRADIDTYLPGDVLHKVDRMSMAHGLEVRSPFLDVDLQAFALGLPDSVRLSGNRTKPVLRDLARRKLPASVAEGRKKGFGVPLDDWFRGDLREIALSLFEESHLARDGVLRLRYWELLWNEHQAKKAQHGERLYALLALEMWYRLFIGGKPALARPAALS